MDIKELMIGDWVYYNPNVFIEDEYEPTKPIKITKITSGEDIDLAIEGCYSPIPLTPEILEKNGFKHIERIPIMGSEIGTWRSDKLGGATIKKYLIGIEKTIFCLIAGHSKIGDIYHLHELQHALRLCGIEKEITL